MCDRYTTYSSGIPLEVRQYFPLRDPLPQRSRSASAGQSLCVRDHNSGAIVSAFVVESRMPDAVHEHAFGSGRKGDETRITFVALRATELHLDELVIVQGPLRLRDDGRGHARRADEDD